MKIGLGLVAFLTLFAVGKTIPTDIPYADYGIIVVFAWFVKEHFRELRDSREERKAQEKIRHQDAVMLSETMRTMTAQCAETQANASNQTEQERG